MVSLADVNEIYSEYEKQNLSSNESDKLKSNTRFLQF